LPSRLPLNASFHHKEKDAKETPFEEFEKSAKILQKRAAFCDKQVILI
jgi:hypothetical protein